MRPFAESSEAETLGLQHGEGTPKVSIGEGVNLHIDPGHLQMLTPRIMKIFASTTGITMAVGR